MKCLDIYQDSVVSGQEDTLTIVLLEADQEYEESEIPLRIISQDDTLDLQIVYNNLRKSLRLKLDIFSESSKFKL